MDLYFKFKLYSELIIVGLFVLAIVLVILKVVISCMKESRKENYLASIGFEKKMWRVASVGNHCDYRYIREEDDVCIEDYEFDKMSLRELKKKYKQLKKN